MHCVHIFHDQSEVIDANKQTVVTGIKISTWILHCVDIFHDQSEVIDANKQTVVTGMKTSTLVLHCVHIRHAQTQSKVIMLTNIPLCRQVSRPPPGCHHCCIFRH